MKLFHKKKEPLPIPEPFTAADIKVEASTCTGERTIGMRSRCIQSWISGIFTKSTVPCRMTQQEDNSCADAAKRAVPGQMPPQEMIFGRSGMTLP